MKSGIDLDKLARLQMASDMRGFRLRGLSEQIQEARLSAAAELATATRGAAEVFSPTDSIEKVLASLTSELTEMRRAGDYTSFSLSTANERIEAAKRCARHRARMAAMIGERAKLELVQQEQGKLLRNLNVFAGVAQ
jgi:hypothetical protein